MGETGTKYKKPVLIDLIFTLTAPVRVFKVANGRARVKWGYYHLQLVKMSLLYFGALTNNMYYTSKVKQTQLTAQLRNGESQQRKS